MRQPLLSLLIALAIPNSPIIEAAAADNFLLPVKDRWEYPQMVTFRPGDGVQANVNPPRLSWPYLKEIVPAKAENQPLNVFRLQIARTSDFVNPEVDVPNLDINFYNALAPLEPGEWHWRVGYGKAPEWSEARRFIINKDTPQWDRRVIKRAAEKVGELQRPRMLHGRSDWGAYRQEIEANPVTAAWLKAAIRLGDRALSDERLLGEFPESDARPKGLGNVELRNLGNRISNKLQAATLVTYLWKLTGDPKYAVGKEYLLRAAAWPRGGLSSPESHGGLTKMPTQITDFFAVSYDLLYNDLSKEQKQTLLNAVDWRLRAYFREQGAWWRGDELSLTSLAFTGGSHPYQNTMWLIPAILHTAGDLEISDELLPFVLNYLTGVTSSHGPDEGWTEGQGYAIEKGGTMLLAQLHTELYLPELQVGRNPMLARLGEWVKHLLPIGIDRVPFGDEWGSVEQMRAAHQENARLITWLTGDADAAAFYDSLKGELGNDLNSGLYSRPWAMIEGALRFENKADLSELEPARDALFLDGGWVMTNSRPLRTRNDYRESMGMIFQARPTGGFSHSYASDGSFVWYKNGRTLSSGGGTSHYGDALARESWSHNTVAINGIGQRITNPMRPHNESAARIVAYHSEDDHVWWAADLTDAYPDVPGLEQALRYVVFVDREWFAIFDDLRMRNGEKAQFSWLYHVHDDVPLEINGGGEMRYEVSGVKALLNFGKREPHLEIINQQGRDGWINPITGEDKFPETQEFFERRKFSAAQKRQPPHHNLWLTTPDAQEAATFLVGMAAAGENEEMPKLSQDASGRKITASFEDGRTRSVSFSNTTEADIMIPVDTIAAHAAQARKPVQQPKVTVEPVATAPMKAGALHRPKTDEDYLEIPMPKDGWPERGSLSFVFTLPDIESTLVAAPEDMAGNAGGTMFQLPFMEGRFWYSRKDGQNQSAGINLSLQTTGEPKLNQLALSRLEGRKLYHLVLNWDIPGDKITAYLQGNEQSDLGHWKAQDGPLTGPGTGPIRLGGIIKHEGKVITPISVGDAMVFEEPLTAEQVVQLASQYYLQPLAGEGRTVYEKSIDLDGYDLKLLYEADFNQPLDLTREEELLDGDKRVQLPQTEWVLEGPGAKAETADGALELQTDPSADAAGHLVLWNTREFPSDFLLEYTFTPKNDHSGLGIAFFGAHNPAGETIFDLNLPPRRAEFRPYIMGEIHSYHISPWAADDQNLRRTANMRKNSGFSLVAVGNDLIGGAGPGPHTVRILKSGGNVQLESNGVLALEFQDDGVAYGPVHNKPGLIGLRFMAHTEKVTIHSLKAYALLPSKTE